MALMPNICQLGKAGDEDKDVDPGGHGTGTTGGGSRPHTSHVLQYCEVSFFGPLKADFSGVTRDLSAIS